MPFSHLYNFYIEKTHWESGMTSKPHVLLLGNSIFIDSIAESLLKQNMSVVTRMNVSVYEAKDTVFSIKPDLVIYELGQDISAPLFTPSKDNTDIAHLAIDLDGKMIFLFQCKREPTGSMQELCDFISREIHIKKRSEMEIKSEHTK